MDSDLDPNAFLQSVRELKEKRQKEDNERYEQLEAQIKSSRAARKMEREREATASPPASPATSPQRPTSSSGSPARSNTFTRRPRSSRPTSVDLSPARAASVRPMSMVSIPEQSSPLPSLDSQRFPPAEGERPALGRTMSSAQSRLERGSDRPLSPTKGMGGFVQSAMLKRTDSVNKRWSANPGQSALARHDSTASIPAARDAADNPESRPTSSHSTISNLNLAPDSDIKEKPPLTTRHSRSRSMASFSGQDPIPEGLMSPPLSPSKRWSRSPAKASWLESALARPESPKPSAQAAQPSWMAEITKAKQQRNSAETSLPQDSPDTAKGQDSPSIGQGVLKRSSLRDTGGSFTPPTRNGTPPTRAKPVSLVGKPSLPEPTQDQAETPKEEPSTPAKHETPEELEKEKPVEAKKADEPAPKPKKSLFEQKFDQSRFDKKPEPKKSLFEKRQELKKPVFEKDPEPTQPVTGRQPEKPKNSVFENKPTESGKPALAKQPEKLKGSVFEKKYGEPGKSGSEQQTGKLKNSIFERKPAESEKPALAKQPEKLKDLVFEKKSAETEKSSLEKQSEKHINSVFENKSAESEKSTLGEQPEKLTSSVFEKSSAEPEKSALHTQPEKLKNSVFGKKSAEPERSDLERESPKPLRSKSPVLSPELTLPKPSSADSDDFSTPVFPRSPELKQNITPKPDFRSGLKPRSGTVSAGSQNEPEFKSVFGKLKKAHTEKYVAPDELKGNILRGKAGLALSAGPQKSERRDELRDSLIKKKDEMAIKRASMDVEKPVETKPIPAPVPEALKIKKQLGRSNSTLNIPAPDKQRRDITPEALSFHKNLKGKPRAASPEKRTSVSERSEMKQSTLDSKPAAPASQTTPVEQVTTSKEKDVPPETEKQELPQVEQPEPLKPVKHVESEPTQKEQFKFAASNKIADRFNPALAGILARGPPQASNPSTPRSGSPFSPGTLSRNAQSSQDQEPGEGAQLTHMTKSRAKGPKRRKPKAAAKASEGPANVTPEKRVSSIRSAKSEASVSESPKPAPAQPRPKSAAVRAASINLSRQPSLEPEKPKTPSPTKASLISSTSVESEESKNSTPSVVSAVAEKPKAPIPIKTSFGTPSSIVMEKSRTPTPVKSTLGTHFSSTPEKPKIPSKTFGTPASNSPLSEKSLPRVVSPPSITRGALGTARPLPAKPLPSIDHAAEVHDTKPAMATHIRSPPSAEADKENRSFSVKSAASTWTKQSQQTPPPKRREPIGLPTRQDEEAALRSAGLLSTSPLRYKASPPRLGLGISDPSTDSPKRSDSNEQTPPSSAGAPPKPTKSSRVVSGTLRDSLSTKELPNVPDVLGSKSGRVLADFFGEVPSSSNELQLNTQQVLSSRCGESDKMKTLRKSIQEVTTDGTFTNLPAQEEHILYEKSMYVCTHVFGTANGAKVTEVYLWCGDGISETAIQDTQVHARKVAKDAGTGQRSTHLFVVDQAREPAGFFQALGGIVITRRGSRAESSTKPYMLCGRPHMGHIAFDEVDLSKGSLCSEYPYIIARPVTLQETKVFLWKGSGCGPDAIGSARLIGMDLNPTGDIHEYEEGNEPPELLRLLKDPNSDICKSPALWNRANVSWEHSACRLFRIEASVPKQSATSLFTSFLSRRPSWSAPAGSPRPGSSSPTHPSGFEATISEIAPFTQDDLEPEGCYVLDVGFAVLVLPGPLFADSALWQHAFVQALLFAHDYAILSASTEDRPAIPRAQVVLGRLPREARVKFRRWEEARGLWGTGAVMAGRSKEGGGGVVEVREALEVCCGL